MYKIIIVLMQVYVFLTFSEKDADQVLLNSVALFIDSVSIMDCKLSSSWVRYIYLQMNNNQSDNIKYLGSIDGKPAFIYMSKDGAPLIANHFFVYTVVIRYLR